MYEVYIHSSVNGEIIMKFNILYIFILNMTKTYCRLENAATILGGAILNNINLRRELDAPSPFAKPSVSGSSKMAAS